MFNELLNKNIKYGIVKMTQQNYYHHIHNK